MTNEFYEWLKQCPVQWVRLDYDYLYSEFATYEFYADNVGKEEDYPNENSD